ncbi:hypothetical protein EVAR_29236_1 [Eumeta japonica]|uniref:Uncharacterized protein n=1 Tax=Eumeta variegata TaxID=151549 RepID=A0A4C1VIR6_EUMVA|nr:hypothetical protein EVAR_29236_1 [Eumeta japonica]
MLTIIGALEVSNDRCHRCDDILWKQRLSVFSEGYLHGSAVLKDLRLGVLVLLIIARLTVDEKTAQRRWFPCTVELSDEERYRLETWRIGAAHHRSIDCGRVDALVLHSRLV